MLIVIVVVVAIIVSVFIALFILSAAAHRMGQSYMKALYLKDVADRFAVVDRAATQKPANANQEDLSQQQLRAMLQEEIRSTQGRESAPELDSTLATQEDV